MTRKLLTFLIMGAVLWGACITAFAQTSVQVGKIPDLRATVFLGAVTTFEIAQNNVEVLLDIPDLPTGWSITLSLTLPPHLEAKHLGSSVGSDYPWTLDISIGGVRYHSLLRGLQVVLVTVPNDITSTSFPFEVTLLSDGNLYHPNDGTISLASLGWDSTFTLSGEAQLQAFGEALALTGEGNLYGYRLPTNSTPVIPDASTVTLLVSGLLPVATLWRRIKA